VKGRSFYDPELGNYKRSFKINSGLNPKKEINHGMVLLAFFFLLMDQGQMGARK
jgi:hypothetical protein